MKLKSVAVLAVCGAFVALIAANVSQVKYTAFAAVGNANPSVDGVGKMKLDSNNRIKIQFTVSGLLPNASYRVSLSGGDLEGVEFGATATGGNGLETNPAGNGHWDGETGGTVLTGDEKIHLWYDADGDLVLDDGEQVAVSVR